MVSSFTYKILYKSIEYGKKKIKYRNTRTIVLLEEGLGYKPNETKNCTTDRYPYIQGRNGKKTWKDDIKNDFGEIT